VHVQHTADNVSTVLSKTTCRSVARDAADQFVASSAPVFPSGIRPLSFGGEIKNKKKKETKTFLFLFLYFYFLFFIFYFLFFAEEIRRMHIYICLFFSLRSGIVCTAK
jgi:hypothetical protein